MKPNLLSPFPFSCAESSEPSSAHQTRHRRSDCSSPDGSHNNNGLRAAEGGAAEGGEKDGRAKPPSPPMYKNTPFPPQSRHTQDPLALPSLHERAQISCCPKTKNNRKKNVSHLGKTFPKPPKALLSYFWLTSRSVTPCNNTTRAPERLHHEVAHFITR